MHRGYQATIERKYFDNFLLANTIPSNTAAAALEANPSATSMVNTVPRGTAQLNRDKREIIMHNLLIRGVIETPIAIDKTANSDIPYAFISIVMDRKTNGLALASEDVYTNIGASIKTGTSLVRNMNYTKRFKVLKSMHIKLNRPMATFDGTNIEYGATTTPFEIYVDLKGIKVNYTAAADNISSISDNSIHVLCTVNHTSLVPVLSYVSRLKFTG